MATIRQLEVFQPDNKRMSAYLERVQIFFAANGVKVEKQVPVLLSVIGTKPYALLSGLLFPRKPSEKTFCELQKVVLMHYEPKPLVIAERLLSSMQQAPGECLSDYVAELRRLATHCECGAYLNEALCDRLVCGIWSEGTQ